MKSKALYIECPSGISGDMTIGAFLDLGIVDMEELNSVVKELNISNIKLSSKSGEKCGVTGTKFDVFLSDETKHNHKIDHDHQHQHSHDGDHNHSHGEDHSHDHTHDHHDHSHSHDHDHNHSHDHDHTHDHEHGHKHSHDHSHGHHHHANLVFINDLIDKSNLDQKVKVLSKNIFMHVAKSESKIHGKSLNEVHFHEVGAFDSIVDIVLSAYCVVKANVDKIFVSNIHIGTGHVKCDHGILPVPAPATMDILKGLPVYSKNIKSELVTPTGAAILKEIGDEYGITPVMTINNIGYGLGTKDLDIANILRISICEI